MSKGKPVWLTDDVLDAIDKHKQFPEQTPTLVLRKIFKGEIKLRVEAK